MLNGAKDQNEFSARILGVHGDTFINLNQYLTVNGLQKVDADQNDPRRGAEWYSDWLVGDPTKEGVEKVLTVGAGNNG